MAIGGEGIHHSGGSDLFTSLLFLRAIQHPNQLFTSLGRCLLEKPDTQACAPDLVGEISDTTLANDLDEQKHLYAAIGIPEYWVIDVNG